MNVRRILLITLPIAFVVMAYFVTVNTGNQVDEAISCTSLDFSGQVDLSQKVAIYEGKNIEIPPSAYRELAQNQVLGTSNSQRFIEVDLSEQKLKAWDGSSLFLETPVSTGLPRWPTPTGEFRIWVKLRATKMEGGSGKYYYYLPNVPYVMYFEGSGVPAWKGYGLHGTYWHNDFGTPRSHGCVNLPTDVAEKLYYWTDPYFENSQNSVFSSNDNQGTRIVIHE